MSDQPHFGPLLSQKLRLKERVTKDEKQSTSQVSNTCATCFFFP